MVNSKTPAEDQTELLKRYKEMIRNSKHVRKEKKKQEILNFRLSKRIPLVPEVAEAKVLLELFPLEVPLFV